MKYLLYTDGGARNNPGPAGAGAVLYELKVSAKGGSAFGGKSEKHALNHTEGLKVGEWGKYLGEATNNQAEYQALILGLEQARRHGVKELECFLDSELLVKQMNREYRVKDKDLAPLFIKAWNLAAGFKKISFRHVPREQNKEADKLVNQAIDKELKNV